MWLTKCFTAIKYNPIRWCNEKENEDDNGTFGK